MRVLLIEDDSAVAQSIELMLKSESFNVYTTDLGEEGVDLGKLYDYDIILLDLNLPDMSGYEVLRSLRVSKVKTPILILAGLGGIEDKVRGLGFGADDYMTKPFHKDELVARIHAIVRRSNGHAASVVITGDLCVNLDSSPVHLTGKEYQILELLSLRKHDAYQGDVSQQSLRRHGRAGDQDYRCFYLQAQEEAGQRFRRQGLHRDGMGARLCTARAERGWGEDFRLTILRAPWRGAGARHREQLTSYAVVLLRMVLNSCSSAASAASNTAELGMLRMFSRQEFRSCVPLSYKSIRPHNAHAEYLSFSAMVIPFESVRVLCYPTC